MSNSKDKEMEIVSEDTMQEELKELRAQYSTLSKEIKDIQNDEMTINSLQQKVESINREFEQINENIQAISDRLNTMPIMPKIRMRKKGMIRKAFRRGAIRTVGAFIAVGDAVAQKAYCVKEGAEDIVAEAYYENQKRRMDLGENNC